MKKNKLFLVAIVGFVSLLITSCGDPVNSLTYKFLVADNSNPGGPAQALVKSITVTLQPPGGGTPTSATLYPPNYTFTFSNIGNLPRSVKIQMVTHLITTGSDINEPIVNDLATVQNVDVIQVGANHLYLRTCIINIDPNGSSYRSTCNMVPPETDIINPLLKNN